MNELRHRARTLLIGACLTTLLGACSGPRIDLDGWRREQVARIAHTRADSESVETRLARIEDLRSAMKLEESRALALQVVAQHANDARALTAASRAESDALYLLEDRRSRDHAAASALDYAERADRAGAATAADRAQLGWALGASTHLQPMFDRAAHARRTLTVVESALELDPAQPVALATLAMLHLRLETLPWIASAMAFGAPDSSLKEAERAALAACQAEPSRENRLALAKVLIARKNRAGARAALDIALSATPGYPRDVVLKPMLLELRASLD